MPMVQILVERTLTASEGQQSLETMHAHLQNQPNPGQVAKLHIPGVTRRENPFPEWLRSDLVRNNFTYDSVNLVYYRKFPDESQVERFCEWFQSKFRAHYAHDHEKNAFMTSVLCQGMADHKDVEDKETF